jgi:hypothetical protein
VIAGQPHHQWPKLWEVLERCEKLGCVKRELTGELVTDEGVYKIYYIINVATRDFVIIDEIEDNEAVPPSFRDSLERRLGITLGFPL